MYVSMYISTHVTCILSMCMVVSFLLLLTNTWDRQFMKREGLFCPQGWRFQSLLGPVDFSSQGWRFQSLIDSVASGPVVKATHCGSCVWRNISSHELDTRRGKDQNPTVPGRAPYKPTTSASLEALIIQAPPPPSTDTSQLGTKPLTHRGYSASRQQCSPCIVVWSALCLFPHWPVEFGLFPCDQYYTQYRCDSEYAYICNHVKL